MPGNPFTDPNWAADLADTVERVVGSVREKTTKPLVTVTRGLVYGLLAAILGIAALVLLIVMLTRGTQELLDQFKVRRSAAVYISYLAVGGIFSLLGLFVLSKRYSKD
jgi:predicted PurR-regulated permease PerM